ncbi:hypothetical protein L208DRAFT_1391150 [Tricholoma matsutake]|nr:hypothetical protein L208DRAFT_1391150 [Tricholoma matsutake 945]
MSGPVLQMLGTKYKVEPFFFSSSINWIPSRYQEDPIGTGDHITVTLTFIRMMDEANANPPNGSTPINQPKGQPKGLTSRLRSALSAFSWLSYFTNQAQELGDIDVLAPVHLHSNKKIIYPDFLGLHMVRDVKSSTIISYHHDIEGSTTSANDLFTRVKLIGRSVYWRSILGRSKDSTFVFLGILWSTLYAWDQALEAFHAHFSWLEIHVLNTNDVAITYELHVMRAHLLHYTSLLRDFRMSVKFVRDTANPAMDSEDIDDARRAFDKELLAKECGNLLSEISRLELYRQSLDDRVQNVQRLVYTSVNIDDSKAMKRLSYISMIFLPASFVANAFGMNIVELNPGGHFSLSRFFATSVPLTLLTVWVIVAFQNRFILHNPNGGMWRRLLWPIMALHNLTSRMTPKNDSLLSLHSQ